MRDLSKRLNGQAESLQPQEFAGREHPERAAGWLLGTPALRQLLVADAIDRIQQGLLPPGRRQGVPRFTVTDQQAHRARLPTTEKRVATEAPLPGTAQVLGHPSAHIELLEERRRDAMRAAAGAAHIRHR